MGDFFASPHQRASENLYDMALRGDVVGFNLIRNQARSAQTALRSNINSQTGVARGDTLAQLASAGVDPSSAGVAALQDRAVSPILARGQEGELQLDAQTASTIATVILNQLSTGLAGLSKSSTAGDILAGVTTLGNVGAGVAMMGGSQGFNWWGAPGAANGGGSGNTLLDWLNGKLPTGRTPSPDTYFG